MCVSEWILSLMKFPWFSSLTLLLHYPVLILFNFQMYMWLFNTWSNWCFLGVISRRSSSGTSINFKNKSSILQVSTPFCWPLHCSSIQTICIVNSAWPMLQQLPDTKVVTNCNSTNHSSPKPANNMWDSHLFFITTICAVNHRRSISLKTALARVIS